MPFSQGSKSASRARCGEAEVGLLPGQCRTLDLALEQAVSAASERQATSNEALASAEFRDLPSQRRSWQFTNSRPGRKTSMHKLNKFSLALVLGILMGLSLFTSATFAQSVKVNHASTARHVVQTTSTQQIATNPQQTNSSQQSVAPDSRCGWYGCHKNPRIRCFWDGSGRGGWWRRFFVCRRGWW